MRALTSFHLAGSIVGHLHRPRGRAARTCRASGWTTTLASVDRRGDGDHQCPVCSAHVTCRCVDARDVRIPDHRALPAVTVITAVGHG